MAIVCLKVYQDKFGFCYMRRFTSTVPARGARASNRAISNSCYNVCPGSEQIVSVGYDLHVRSLPQVYVDKYSRLS